MGPYGTVGGNYFDPTTVHKRAARSDKKSKLLPGINQDINKNKNSIFLKI